MHQLQIEALHVYVLAAYISDKLHKIVLAQSSWILLCTQLYTRSSYIVKTMYLENPK